VSHISLEDLHSDILKNSLESSAEAIMFWAIQSSLAILHSSLVHWDKGFLIKDPFFLSFGMKGPFSIESRIP